jgi:hypothetical protein
MSTSLPGTDDVELPGVVEDGMSGKNGQRKPGTCAATLAADPAGGRPAGGIVQLPPLLSPATGRVTEPLKARK